MIHPLSHHADTALASFTSAGTTLSLAATAPPIEGEPLTWVPYLMSVIGPVAILVVNRVLSAKAAARRARAVFEEAEAERKRTDADPANDSEARDHALRAAELRAEADALEALRPAGPR